MATVRCLDGSVLELRPVPVLARDQVAYEVTLHLLRDGAPFGAVGERCGWLLTSAATRLRAARTGDGAPPTTAVEAGVRRWAARTGTDPDRAWAGLDRDLPRDRELLSLRARDPDDGDGTGELRIEVRRLRRWQRDADGRGRWATTDRAVLDACDDDGVGVRAELGCEDLLDLLEVLLAEVAAAGRSGGARTRR